MKKGRVKVLAAALASACLLSGMVVNAAEPEAAPETAAVEQEPAAQADISAEEMAALYVQAMLDAYIKQDPTMAFSLGYLSTEEWEDASAADMEEIRELFSDMQLSDEALNGMNDACMNILSRAKYMAGSTRQLEDGSYAVTVTCEQINVFETFWEKYIASYETMQNALLAADPNIGYADMLSQAVLWMMDLCNQSCEEAVYKEPVSTVIIVYCNDGEFEMDQDTMEAATSLMFDFEYLLY